MAPLAPEARSAPHDSAGYPTYKQRARGDVPAPTLNCQPAERLSTTPAPRS